MTNSTAYAKGGTTGVSTKNRAFQIIEHEINLANIASTVTTGGNARIVYIPADTAVRFLRAEIVTAVSLDSASSGRIDIGDNSDDDQFVSNQTTFTAGTDMTILTLYGEDGQVYTAANAINIKLTGDKLAGGTANATGIVRFVWEQADVSRNATAVAS